MLKVLYERLRQGSWTSPFPVDAPALPDRFRGLPVLDGSRCADGCGACADACPTEALKTEAGRLEIDLGRCLFCGECAASCPEGAVAFGRDHRLATSVRDDLILRDGGSLRLASELRSETLRVLGRSLALRQVSAGGCNGCEVEVAVLNTVVYDLARFGIRFVASPRHADGVLVTGPVTARMREALEATWSAVPEPKIAIAVGACAVSGGPYRGHPEAADGAGSVVPIDLFVPGCPPHPWTILDGLLRILARMESRAR